MPDALHSISKPIYYLLSYHRHTYLLICHQKLLQDTERDETRNCQILHAQSWLLPKWLECTVIPEDVRWDTKNVKYNPPHASLRSIPAFCENQSVQESLRSDLTPVSFTDLIQEQYRRDHGTSGHHHSWAPHSFCSLALGCPSSRSQSHAWRSDPDPRYGSWVLRCLPLLGSTSCWISWVPDILLASFV